MNIKRKRNSILLVSFISIGIILFWNLDFLQTSKANQLKIPSAEIAIVARGHIEPEGSVLTLHGAMPSSVIRNLLVVEGSNVVKGQPVAYLEGYDTQRASLLVAEAAVQYYASQQRQAVDGAKKSSIEAQQNVVEAKRGVELRAKRDLERIQSLFSEHLVSQQALDSSVTDRNIAAADLAQAKSSLAALSEVRGVDRDVVAARVAMEVAAVVKAKKEFERTIVRSPVDGTVLSVSVRDGEVVGAGGIMRVACLDQLHVIAEVDEHFLSKIRLGDPSVIQGNLIHTPIKATVISIGKEIFKQTRRHHDTLIGRDARVVEVKLKALSPLPVVIGGEVDVRFTIDPKNSAARPAS